MDQRANVCCSGCSREFQPRFRYQVREEAGRFVYLCSHSCLEAVLTHADAVSCTTCAKGFTVEFPWQVQATDKQRRYYCSETCHALRVAEPTPSGASSIPAPTSAVRRIAVFNHKGGTGKTTTAVNLAAAFADRGHRVLLVDADGQGNVGASLGIRGEKTLYHVLVHGVPVEDAVIPVRANLDVLTSNETLAAAELHLATRPNRDRVLREKLGAGSNAWDVVVLDCAPALSLMNQNALVFTESVLVPVSCDYLALVGVKQVLRTIKNVRELLKHDVRLAGVLPTFFDTRTKICREAWDALRQHFGDRCLPPIRVSTKLREAPSVRKTIFEYAPDSHAAEDYLACVERMLAGPSAASIPAPAPVLGLETSAIRSSLFNMDAGGAL